MSRMSPVSEWLLPVVCILCGAAGAVLVWGAQSEDRVTQNQQLEKFRALDEEQQLSIRRSFADLKAQSESRKAMINTVHSTVKNDPALRDTMERYYRWWSALDQSEWDAFQEMTPEDRLTFARTRMNAEVDPSKQIVVEFGGPVSSRLPPLHLTFEEFGRIIDEALADTEKPAALQEELNALSSRPHRTLRLALWIFDSLPNQSDSTDAERRGKQLQRAVENNVSDKVWKARFTSSVKALSGKVFERPWIFMTLFSILSNATTTLGEDLHHQFPVTDQQIKDAFASMKDKELQQSMMTMPANEARTQLQFLAQTTADDSPEEKLLARYMQFVEKRERSLRSAIWGFDGPGPFQSNRENGPGGRPRGGGGRRQPPDGPPPRTGAQPDP